LTTVAANAPASTSGGGDASKQNDVIWVPSMLIMGSDGLWDVMQPNDAMALAEAAGDAYESGDKSFFNAISTTNTSSGVVSANGVPLPGEALIKRAMGREGHLQRGVTSNDNITLVICKFSEEYIRGAKVID
jgi:serine/threonine protein phosphatase PrpC